MRSLSLLLVATSFAGSSVAAPCGGLVSSVSKTISWFTGYGDGVPASILPGGGDRSPDTIYQVLKDREEFSKLVQLIDKVPDVREMLDGDKKMTFFAPTNDAIERHRNPWNNEGGDQDRDKEMKRILEDTMRYHCIPEVIEYHFFGQNSTIATQLQARDGSFDDARRRIKFERSSLPPFDTTLNNQVRITETDLYAKNGVVQVIDRPLYLPPDIADIIYNIPNRLSISSLALLKTNLQDNVEFNSQFKKGGKNKDMGRHNDRYGRGCPASTLFVPTNEAWERLPRDLVSYLFSPMGERTLRKLLAWHTLPNSVVFTEWGRVVDRHKHRKDRHGSSLFDDDDDDRDLSFEWDRHFDSFIDQKMPVHVKKVENRLPGSRNMYNVEMQVHGVFATMIDNPAQNGVFHTLPQVLSPRSVEGINEAQNMKDWQEWREWLMEWSSQHEEVDSE
ncbi:hypothetical protein FRB96_002928 [Tulasnella sp. 330]|nr:hypothetical protein FRB96_002928 [Tulasnella sp. 330]KAG8874214.1 hypothetical protein FRB97_006076 [Tulasnella sp. 331]